MTGPPTVPGRNLNPGIRKQDHWLLIETGTVIFFFTITEHFYKTYPLPAIIDTSFYSRLELWFPPNTTFNSFIAHILFQLDAYYKYFHAYPWVLFFLIVCKEQRLILYYENPKCRQERLTQVLTTQTCTCVVAKANKHPFLWTKSVTWESRVLTLLSLMRILSAGKMRPCTLMRFLSNSRPQPCSSLTTSSLLQ